jgi:L-ribulose-5-phosphate 4-epimerase
MRPEEIRDAYERNTGQVIVQRFAKLDPAAFTAVLVHGHGPFCWGAGAREAAHTAVIVEELAQLAYYTVTIDPNAVPISKTLRDKHFNRKHGPKAYYGQDRDKHK